MTVGYGFSPRAQSDLDEIWDYTEECWGAARAEACVRELWRAVIALAEQPILGRPCPEVRDGYYKYRSGSHVIFFRRDKAGIDVVRILHGRMDFDRHL